MLFLSERMRECKTRRFNFHIIQVSETAKKKPNRKKKERKKRGKSRYIHSKDAMASL